MKMTSKQIVEALKMQPLSEEEKNQRHILGRLYGPIATCNASTRNGRRYNKDLWERALADDLFKEKIANKSLFLELGHPANREETDMEKVCACIPEMPKIVDGNLYAYVDILDTQNGRLLKTLCDYGFIPGISSRGSGDVMPNDEVDPETFFLETWDIVQIPAVKDARLQMCEGLDAKSAKLKKVLAESYTKASAEDKKVIKEALDNLEITFDEEELPDDDTLVESKDDADTEEVEEVSEEEMEETTTEDSEETEDEETDEEEVAEEPAEEAEEDEESVADTLGDFIDQLGDYDKKLSLEFKPIEIDGKEYTIAGFEWDDSEEGKLVVETVIEPQEIEDNIEDEILSNDEEISDEADKDSEEADDIGDDETIESLKEMIRQKELLKQENEALKSTRAVRDAEVDALKEELSKYKSAFARTSEIASTAKKANAEVKVLKEQLQTKNTEITSLKRKQSVATNEQLIASKRAANSLQEAVDTKNAEVKRLTEKLATQKTVYEQKLGERTKVAKYYKGQLEESLAHYMQFRASILGVKVSEISNKLDEHYTIEDIDKACEEVLTESVNIARLPYGFNNGAKITISGRSQKANNSTSAGGYDIDDSLLELAGLK